MQIIVCDTADQVAEQASEWVRTLVQLKTKPVLGLATGSTPVRLYQQLIKLHQQGLSFRDCQSFNLDEYYDIDPSHRQSYRHFMQQQLFDHIDIAASATHLPSCRKHQNPYQMGFAYEQAIEQAGGIDLQVLGIGSNGHIGFNEPTSSLASRTRLKTLTAQTLQDNSRLFAPDETQPTMAMTMGIATIMQARYVLLLATGETKAAAVAAMVHGPISAQCPASILQLHEHAIVVLDQAAASQLQDVGYLQQAANRNADLVSQFGQHLAFWARQSR